MPFRIGGTSLGTTNLVRNINEAQKGVQEAQEALDTGKQQNNSLNSVLGSTFENQLRSTQQAQRNTQDGLSMVQETQDAVSELRDRAESIRDFAKEASKDSTTDSERSDLQDSIQDEQEKISELLDESSFNDKSLLDGQSVQIQTGPDAGQTSNVQLPDATNTGLGTVDASTQDGAKDGVEAAKDALDQIGSMERSLDGQNQALKSTIDTLDKRSDATDAVRGRLQDADEAQTKAKKVSNEIQLQRSQSLLDNALKVRRQTAATLIQSGAPNTAIGGSTPSLFESLA